MVLPASTAASLTATAITTSDEEKVNQEISLAESQILSVIGKGFYRKLYNARIIGNPIGAPSVDAHLTALQIEFRDAFEDAGYVVGLDTETGYWSIDWSD